MARLDVRRLKSKGPISLVLEIQSDLMRDLPTVLVAPLIETKALKPFSLINPLVEVGGRQMAVRLEQMVGAPAARLGEPVVSLRGIEHEVSVALGRLLFYA